MHVPLAFTSFVTTLSSMVMMVSNCPRLHVPVNGCNYFLSLQLAFHILMLRKAYTDNRVDLPGFSVTMRAIVVDWNTPIILAVP